MSTCAHCRGDFVKQVHNQIYCSPECCREAWQVKTRMDPAKKTVPCPICGTLTTRSGSNKTAYCSDECRREKDRRDTEAYRTRLGLRKNLPMRTVICKCGCERSFTTNHPRRVFFELRCNSRFHNREAYREMTADERRVWGKVQRMKSERRYGREGWKRRRKVWSDRYMPKASLVRWKKIFGDNWTPEIAQMIYVVQQVERRLRKAGM